MNPKSSPQSLRRLLFAGASLAVFSSSSAVAQTQTGDEWFDPTDWFGGNKTDKADPAYGVYDYDFNYGLGSNFDFAEWSSYGRWGYEVWEKNYYDAGHWDRQDWNAELGNAGEPDKDVQNFVIYPQARTTRAQGKSPRAEQPSEGGRGQVSRLNGTIDGLQTVQLRRESGATGPYAIAKVRLENDKNAVVNLGRFSQVKGLNLKKGDVIEAVGRRGTVGGKTVFVAQRLKAGNRTIDANPVIRLADEGRGTVSGTVAEVKQTKAATGSPSHTLLELKLTGGKSATVDLGPGASVEKIGLQAGERVTVRGQTEQKDGRAVVIPELIKVAGETASEPK